MSLKRVSPDPKFSSPAEISKAAGERIVGPSRGRRIVVPEMAAFWAYLLSPASIAQFIVYDPVAKQGPGIACFFAIPWLLGHALRILREP